MCSLRLGRLKLERRIFSSASQRSFIILSEFALSLHQSLSPFPSSLLLLFFVLWQSELIKALVYWDRPRVLCHSYWLKQVGQENKEKDIRNQSGQFSLRLEGPGCVPTWPRGQESQPGWTGGTKGIRAKEISRLAGQMCSSERRPGRPGLLCPLCLWLSSRRAMKSRELWGLSDGEWELERAKKEREAEEPEEIRERGGVVWGHKVKQPIPWIDVRNKEIQ